LALIYGGFNPKINGAAGFPSHANTAVYKQKRLLPPAIPSALFHCIKNYIHKFEEVGFLAETESSYSMKSRRDFLET